MEGTPRLNRGADPSIDRFLNRRRCARQLRNYVRMRLFSPYSDPCVDGSYRGGLVNLNAQAIYPDQVRLRRGDTARERRAKRALDRLILRDARGRRLYVPFGCKGGRCPQFAADIGSPRWRAHLARRARRELSHRYRGIFLDDVNWAVNVSDGREQLVRPRDPRTRRPMTDGTWKRAMAALVRAVARQDPRREVMVNTVWWKPESTLDDPLVADTARRVTWWELERGFEDVRRGQSFDGLLALIDRLHSLGVNVNLGNYFATDRPAAEFELAGHLLTGDGRDTLSTEYRVCPASDRRYRSCRGSFWAGYRVRLGAALGPRQVRPDGLYERPFQRGMVLVNPPGAPARSGMLDGLYRDLDGTPRVFAGLAGGQALVLTR